MSFSETSWFTQSFTWQKQKCFIYTYHLYINIMTSSLLVIVLAGVCTCCFHLSGFSVFSFFCLFLSGLWFKSKVAITVARSCEMMLVPVRSFRFFLTFMILFKCSVNCVHGDYPYKPQSITANISETGLQSPE